MYSPKISEDLIPTLYQMSREKRKPMTKMVNEILREKIASYQKTEKENQPNPSH